MKTVIISLGGSIVVPNGIDIGYLKKLKLVVSKLITDYQIALIVGGGRTCRDYQRAARSVSNASDLDCDWVGIMSTRLNAELVRAVFFDIAYEKVILNPTEEVRTTKRLLIGAGWEPGCSTDCDAVLLAETLKADMVVNLTNVSYVYDKDPNKYKYAKKIESISWKEFLDLIENSWEPGANVVFDPIAAKKANKLGLTVAITNGHDLKNVEKLIKGEKFVGTLIGG